MVKQYLLSGSKGEKITLAKAGNTTISISYSAPLPDSNDGYLSFILQLNGKKEEIIGTQFETTFARQSISMY